jgi:osmoprotectant transport system ATP-binding protein
MLELVGLEPGDYRHRYPRQLSGGQQQRVGVARALAADPPIMLMDEPFGAVDPITRGRLQDEFLALQQNLGKTIVFVTHDFDEAIKLGDRIAILREDSTIAQYATPEEILSNPADEFVEGFIGRGAMLKRLALERLSEVDLRPAAEAGRDPSTISIKATLHDVLDTMLTVGHHTLAVVSGDEVVGSIALEDLLSRFRELREGDDGKLDAVCREVRS